MAAYYNTDWAECYDLWVRTIFGDGPVEDIPVFTSILSDIATKRTESSSADSITIVDVGTGSGRVLVDLQDTMAKVEGTKLEVWGLEPSESMLERAKRFWEEGVQKKGITREWQVRWVQCGATDLAGTVLEGSTGADLVIFAAGGICHVTEDGDVERFLSAVRRVLKKDGVAVVSILKDFILDDVEQLAHQQHGGSATEQGQLPQRIPSVDHPGLVYIKHPTSETIKGGVKTEKFKLDVEKDNEVLRSHELSWDEKMFEKAKWEGMVVRAGLRVREVREGGLQLWYLLEQAEGA